MKINIAKLLSGGGFGLLHSAIPGAPQEALFGLEESNESGGKNNTTPQILSKEVLNELSKHGLPNDFEAFMNIYVQFQNRMLSGNVSNSQIAKVSSLANRIISNNNYFDKAFDICNQNNALDDFAIDQNGYIYSLNQKGGLEKVRFKDFNPSKYKALTYGELADLRRNSPSLINDTETILAIGSAISLEKINDFIQNILSKVKTTETKEETLQTLRGLLGQDIRGMSDQELNSLKALAEASDKIGLDSIFKTERFTKNSNTALALLYLMRILPRNMRAQLQGSYVAQGGSYKDSQQHASSVILSAALMASENAFRTGISYDSSLNAAMKELPKSGTSKTFYQTTNEALFDADLNLIDIPITDHTFGDETGIIVKGVRGAALTTDENNAVSNLPLGIAFNATIGKYLDKDKMYMGELKITEGMLNDIAYSSDPVAVVYVPVNGRHEIDWAGMHGFSAAEREIKEKGITAIEDKNKVHEKHGSYAHYDENNNIVSDTITEQYFLTYGYTIDDKIDNNNGMVEELNGDKEDQIDGLIKSIYNKSLKQKFGISNISEKNTWDDIFRVPIFVKVNQFAPGDAYRYGGHGSIMTPKTLEEDKLLQLILQQPQTTVYGNSSLLY